MLTDLPIWETLTAKANAIKSSHMRDMFVADPERAQRYKVSASGLNIDFSKNIIDDEVFGALTSLFQQSNVEEKRNAMFQGEVINTTEGRAVLHTALRNKGADPIYVDGKDIMPDVRDTLAKMKDFVESIHTGSHKGYTGKPIKHIVAIGIGGSFLGPKIMTEALKPYQTDAVKVHFVANVDGCHIHDVLDTLDHEETLVVMSSKSFSTQETLQNTLTAKDWFIKSGGNQNDVSLHFIAISSNVEAAVEFGIDADNIFPMWDWVGGRYSLWSAIGLPIALALGFEHFDALLEGAFEMDTHFLNAPADQNLPMILAGLGIWYRHFFDAQSQVLLPYYHYLRGLPAYVQQLDMESNGKQVDITGQRVDYPTGPIIWGSEGTNGQHSFHQLIHQGAGCMPIDFIFPLTAQNTNHQHHAMLASNCFGQAQALMQGKSFEECYKDLENKGLSASEQKELAQHKTMPGNKPSTTITFNALTPKILGALIAMYEHKVFVQGVVWGLNSFDQWGVELGKVLGSRVLDGLNGDTPLSTFDTSTSSLIKQFQDANPL
nr:glucose-6-phosphate isomerase [Alteromonas sp. 5E99-2]